MYWLFKTEPKDYAFADLIREGQTVWSGVKNSQARGNLRKIEPGDEIFIYHTGREKCIVGVAQAVSTSYEREDDDTVVDITHKYALARPVLLSEIKAVSDFLPWALVRQPRLSVMPVTPEHWFLLHDMAREARRDSAGSNEKNLKA